MVVAFILALLPSEFVATYYPYAKAIEETRGISVQITLTQAAIETGWGKSIKGNNLFGVKSFNQYEPRQLFQTTEYHPHTCYTYPEVISIVKKGKLYKYVVMDWFRLYYSPYESFYHYTTVIECYFPSAWYYKCEPEKFFKALKGKYATNPEAYTLQLKVLKMVQRYEQELLQGEKICY